MEPKLFFDVFPTIEVDQSITGLLGQTRIVRLGSADNGQIVRIYMTSDHLFTYRQATMVRNAIESKLSSNGRVRVYLYFKYNLSAQYNIPKLYDVYQDSILEEMKENDRVLYDMLNNASVDCSGDHDMHITLENGILQKEKTAKLEAVLTKIFTDRCGLDVHISITMNEPVDTEANKGWTGSWVRDTVAAPGTGAGQGSDNLPGETEGSAAAGENPDTVNMPGVQRQVRGGRNVKKAKTLTFSDDPNVIYRKDVTEDAQSIADIQGEIGDVIIHGQVSALETRGIKGDRTIVMFVITDFEDSIKVKIFVEDELLPELLGSLQDGKFVKLSGKALMDSFDHEISISSVSGIRLIPDFRATRMDTAEVKRVELHCHTQMSELDAVTPCAELVRRAYSWGMKALAITDHGVVHGFTDAFHTWQALWGKESEKRKAAGDPNPDPQDFFKIIYGCEAYLVDDLEKVVTGDLDRKIADQTYVVFDIETTGFSPVNDRIIEIGAVKIRGGEVIDRYSTFVNPEIPIPFDIETLTHINDNMVMGSPTIEHILPEFLEFIEGPDTVLVGHNVKFDVSFIRENMKRILHEELPYTYADTAGMARVVLPGHKKYTLDAVAKLLNVRLDTHHRAVDDAECTAWIYIDLMKKILAKGIEDFAGLNDFAESGTDIIKSLHPYHCIILAKNNTGRVNLYKLVSFAHLNYFSRVPRIPKSKLQEYREGLIIGSACEAGELFEALENRQSEEKIANIVEFYDYLEIQPVDNNRFMIASPKRRNINSEEDIRDINRAIVELGEKWNKPVVATCDVHFMDPEDNIYRKIVLAGHGFEDADDSPPLYLRTTDEMLQEFSYLGDKKAYEVVVVNTNMIADMIDSMSPVRPDKCPPVIPDSDKTLREICENKAHEIYGPDLPRVVEDRMEKELDSIIGNGFAVMYIIAQKLVWKSVEDGYLVGSRGSVGSSFVAFLAGISEVNSLAPHYYCPECHYVDFDSEEVRAYGGMAGCDMPPKNCPVCGKPLNRDGFDIPFETFLGFNGDKEPDIDLNFSSEYQSKAHAYTEVIFGAGQTYRAGTISTLAGKTAYGYASHYYSDRQIIKRRCEIERIAARCEGARTTTGQHPGGIVVLPVGEEIYTFTPIQHPANKEDSESVTTHFDYHSIDHNLLKLDILGKDDPTQVRILYDLTGLDPLDVPLDDEKVMSLFQNTEALGITPADIGGTRLGCLAIPEFGTDNCINMVLEAKPQHLSDLIRISGLGHGEGVWGDNAQTLIRDGKATISTAICCRDDIMIYLIQKGLEPGKSFDIMEKVRKGQVAKGKVAKWESWKEDMKAHDVPDWYIWSCEQIKYMFPKAHAAAYVLMAWRMGYYKIYYPLAFYTTYFSIKETGTTGGFSYEKMGMGRGALEKTLSELRAKSKNEKLESKEKNMYRAIRVAEEMYARGIEFAPIDIMKADSRRFTITDDGRIMPSINSIDGIGDELAESIAHAATQGEFLSKDEFRARTKASQTNVEKLSELGIIDHLPQSGQLSIFDFMKGNVN
ncbi:MAG: PolC-type DNA polymerase III [Lachnospiraceae bacterium]|nr:PolC-type DNA polymerase III [Lachnospiraceae bacterium]